MPFKNYKKIFKEFKIIKIYVESIITEQTITKLNSLQMSLN